MLSAEERGPWPLGHKVRDDMMLPLDRRAPLGRSQNGLSFSRDFVDTVSVFGCLWMCRRVQIPPEDFSGGFFLAVATRSKCWSSDQAQPQREFAVGIGFSDPSTTGVSIG